MRVHVRKPAKSPAADKPVRRGKILEDSGDPIATNYYIKVGLSRVLVRELTRLGKRWSVREAPCATMGRYLIALGLIKMEETEAKLEALLRYIGAEGFHSLGVYCDEVLKRRGPS